MLPTLFLEGRGVIAREEVGEGVCLPLKPGVFDLDKLMPLSVIRKWKTQKFLAEWCLAQNTNHQNQSQEGIFPLGQIDMNHRGFCLPL